MNCPQCNEHANRGNGGVDTLAGRIKYYFCKSCDIRFSVTGETVKVLGGEPDLPYRSKHEAFRAVRMAVRDDTEWFGEVTDETRELARHVVREFIFKASPKPRPVVKRRSVAFGRAGRRMRFEEAA